MGSFFPLLFCFGQTWGRFLSLLRFYFCDLEVFWKHDSLIFLGLGIIIWESSLEGLPWKDLGAHLKDPFGLFKKSSKIITNHKYEASWSFILVMRFNGRIKRSRRLLPNICLSSKVILGSSMGFSLRFVNLGTILLFDLDSMSKNTCTTWITWSSTIVDFSSTVVAFPFATCLANNYFQKFFFFALTNSQLFSLSLGRFCNFSTFSFW